MTYTEAIQFLYDLRLFGTKLGLENTRKLAALVGNPQDKLRFIHVAGTNGKGSVCAMLESIYRAAGLRVGLFTSPHLVSFCERIQVNRQSIPEAEVVRLVSAIIPLWEQFPEGEHPTFFEVVVVMALRYFADQQCDVVIWETGMGGRLDATSIVEPIGTVITNVELDHQKWLGESLELIAREKAGIIKNGVPVVTAVDTPETLRVLLQFARDADAPLYLITPTLLERLPLSRLKLPLYGGHQRLNAALAFYMAKFLDSAIPVSEREIVTGLQSVCWPGRLQLIEREGQKLLFDGAHNSHGMRILARTLDELFPGKRPALLLGILEDKDWRAMCATIAPLAGRILLVPVSSMRTATPQELVPCCRSANPDIEVAAYATLDEALLQLTADPLVVVTGSLYLVGEVMEKLGTSTAGRSERHLNEWGAPPQPAREAK